MITVYQNIINTLDKITTQPSEFRTKKCIMYMEYIIPIDKLNLKLQC